MSEQYRAPALTGEQIDHILAAMADSFGRQLRSPVLHWPDEQGLDYQDVTFPPLDGAPLESWFIPAPGSDKLIIAAGPPGVGQERPRTRLPVPGARRRADRARRRADDVRQRPRHR